VSATAPPQLPDAFGRYGDEVEGELRRALEGRELPLYDMLRYHFGWRDEHGGPGPGRSGKGLRPVLCLLASDAVHGNHASALPAAAAVELVHNFSLVHDDIQDNDAERHHRPTVWRVFGRAQAINAGTAMYALASLALGRLEEHGVGQERRLAAVELMHDSCLRLLEGQFLDLDFEKRTDVDVTDYLAMVRGKTGALLGCAAAMGALLGGPEPRAEPDAAARAHATAAFRKLGEELGLAFQIRDDMLGIWGDASITGKPVGADISARKKSLPVVDAWQRAEGPQRRELAEAYAAPRIDPATRDRVLGILDGLGAEARARELAERHRERALAAIADLTLDDAARQDLEAFAAFLTERDH